MNRLLPLVFVISTLVNLTCHANSWSSQADTIVSGKKDFHSSLTVKNDQSLYLSPQEMMMGKVPGVQMTALCGDAGNAYKILSRGPSSMYGKDHPLVYVDGVPVILATKEYTNFLNSFNPEDIESIEFLKNADELAWYGFNAFPGVIHIHTKRNTQNKKLSVRFNNALSFSIMSNYMDVLNASQYRNIVNDRNLFEAQNRMGNSDTDWQKEISRTAVGRHHHLALNGALGKTHYRVSVGNNKQDGVIKESDFKRHNLAINLNRALFNNSLTIDLGLQYAKHKQNLSSQEAFESAVSFDPTQKGDKSISIDNLGAEWRNWLPNNPLVILDENRNKADRKNVNWNVNLAYDFPFLENLKAELLIGSNKADGKNDMLILKRAKRPYATDYKYARSVGYDIHTNIVRGNISYFVKLNSFLTSIAAKVGYSVEKDRITQDYFAGGEESYTTGSQRQKVETKSIFKSLELGFFDRLELSVKHREDHGIDWKDRVSSTGLSLSYDLKKEGMATDFLNHFQLKGGYGLLGKNNLKDNGYRLLPERWHNTNLGFNFSLLNQRFWGSMEAYMQKNKGVVLHVPVPSGSSFSSTILTNLGIIENSGVELSLSGVLYDRNHLYSGFQFNAAYNKSKTDFYNSYQVFSVENSFWSTLQVHKKGEELYSYYLYQQIYGNDGKPIQMYPHMNGEYPERRIYKSALPKWIIGFSSHNTYKNWELNFTMRANLGQYMHNSNDMMLGQYSHIPYNLSTDIYNTNFESIQRYSDYYVQNASFLKLENLEIAYHLKSIFGESSNARVYVKGQNLFTLTSYEGLNCDAPYGMDYLNYPTPRTFLLGVELNF